MNKPKPLEQAMNADLRGSWPALQRAARRARELAAQTGTAIVVNRDGLIAYIQPNALTDQGYRESHQEALTEQFIRDDVDWGLHGTD